MTKSFWLISMVEWIIIPISTSLCPTSYSPPTNTNCCLYKISHNLFYDVLLWDNLLRIIHTYHIMNYLYKFTFYAVFFLQASSLFYFITFKVNFEMILISNSIVRLIAQLYWSRIFLITNSNEWCIFQQRIHFPGL